MKKIIKSASDLRNGDLAALSARWTAGLVDWNMSNWRRLIPRYGLKMEVLAAAGVAEAMGVIAARRGDGAGV